jgi:hypothetical protein
MQPRIVPYVNGLRWLLEGWRLFRAAPIGWLALVFAYWLLMSLVSVIPIAGVVAAAVLVPPFSIGFMAAGRAAAAGAPRSLALLFEGFRHGARAQLMLGAIYFACLAAVLGGTLLVDGGAAARWVLAGERPDEDALQSAALYAALGAAALLYAPVMMMFWFAPVLAAWHGAPAAKALFFSFFAFLANWRAFLAYGAGAAVLTTAVPMLALSVLLALSGGTTAVPLAGLLFPLLVVLLPTLFASFYASYRDIFAAGP